MCMYMSIWYIDMYMYMCPELSEQAAATGATSSFAPDGCAFPA